MTKPCAGVVWRDDAEGIRQGDGSSHSGPAHVAFGTLDRLGPCDIGISWLNPTPHKIAVYASPWSSPSTPQHSLPGGRYPLPGPDFHRLERASFPGAPQVGPLLDQVTGPVASFTGDGAYDQDGASRSVAERHPDARVIVPPRLGAVPSKTAETAPTQRDQHLQFIAKHGRMGWQKVSGYNRRALAEATIGRFKRVIGGGLRSRTDQRQVTEMSVAVAVLNRMLELGRPKSVRIA